MGKAATLIEAPIMGSLDTEVNVGDTVMFVTTGYSHNVSVSKGVYKGYIEGTGDKRARIEVAEVSSKWFHKETGEEYSYAKFGYWSYLRRDDFEIKPVKYTRKVTLFLNRMATITSAEESIVDKIGKLV